MTHSDAHDAVVPLTVVELSDGRDLPAGEFAAWLDQTRNNQRTQAGATVPCGTCTACCRSSQFVHIEPDETKTLARIPTEILFPAPGKPKGHLLLGYDSLGRCPMLIDDKCSIYEDRPRTCRNYDCRVFTAAGIEPSEDERLLISERINRWRFDHPTELSQTLQAAVQVATRFLCAHGDCFPGGVPQHPGQLAILAVKVSAVFVKFHNDFKDSGRLPTDSEVVAAIIKASRDFEAGTASDN